MEDKGTDLLVFKKALTGIHYDIAEDCFQYILEGYRGADDFQEILEKIKEIEVRKRYGKLTTFFVDFQLISSFSS